MIDWMMEIFKLAMKKVFEYFMVLVALFMVYALIYTDVWDDVAGKFGFTEDISRDLNEKSSEYTKRLEDGFGNISKSD